MTDEGADVTDPIAAISAIAGIAKAADPEAASLGAKLWGEVLGPPAKELGEHWGRQVRQWSENKQARNVLQLAGKKTDSSKPGAVPPRVAASVLDSAQYNDDEFVAEYLSGVLASARTPNGKDDRGVEWSALVGRLSSDALKLHYVIYSILRRKMRGADVGVMAKWCEKYILVQYINLLAGEELAAPQEAIRRTIDALYSLQREGLLDFVTHGAAEHFTGWPFKQYSIPDQGDVLIASTTIHGVQLFLQGHGYGGVWADAIADADKSFEAVGDVDPRLANVYGVWLDELPLKEAKPERAD